MEALSEPLLSQDESAREGDETERISNVVADEIRDLETSSASSVTPDKAQEARTPLACLLQPLIKALHTPLIPEKEAQESLKVQIRFLKFLGVTLFGVLLTRLIVFSLDWEHRHGLTLYDTWLYDGNAILLDCIALFSVGRLYAQELPVDHLAWILTTLVSSLYTNILPNFKFLQHSVSLYELHCTWPWQLWVFVFGLVLPVVTASVALHIGHAKRQGDLPRKGVEVIGTALLFLVPQMGQEDFEFHHYFAGLLCGMHANYDVPFSRLTMAWCWGQYINGIAVWGRDPTLTCAYAHYSSQRQNCHDGEECWAPWMNERGAGLAPLSEHAIVVRETKFGRHASGLENNALMYMAWPHVSSLDDPKMKRLKENILRNSQEMLKALSFCTS